MADGASVSIISHSEAFMGGTAISQSRSPWIAGALLAAAWASAAGAQCPHTLPPPSSSLPIDPHATPPAVQPPTGRKLTDLSIEELMNIEVISVSRQKQRLGDSAAVPGAGAGDVHRPGMRALAARLRVSARC